MIIINTETPKIIYNLIDNEQSSLFVLVTFRGRYLVDIVIALYVFGMGIVGVILACATLVLVMGIRFVGIKYPDLFNDIFRTPIDDDDQTLMTYDDSYIAA